MELYTTQVQHDSIALEHPENDNEWITSDVSVNARDMC